MDSVGMTQQALEQNQQDNEMNLQDVQELYDCKQDVYIVNIDVINDVDNYRKQIEQLEQNNEKYRIVIDYSINTTLEQKMVIMNMINELNVNQKVGIIHITLYHDNPINTDIIIMMINRYKNVYSISVRDNNNLVDSMIHDQIKQLVRQSVIMRFEIKFLNPNNDGLQLMKEYNQMMEQKQHLKYLRYENCTICKWTRQQELIQQIIEEMNEM